MGISDSVGPGIVTGYARSVLAATAEPDDIHERRSRERLVKTVSLTEAKANLGALVDLAEAGEVVCITRNGKPVARLTSLEPRREKIDFSALRAFTDSLPQDSEPAAVFVRRMRDEDRY